MTTETDAGLRLQRVVILGANGAMGAGAAAMFAAGGCTVTMLARERGKAEQALAAVQSITKSERIADGIGVQTYADGLAGAVAGADLIFEAVAEDLALKREILAQVDAVRPANALVATVSSGLSIRAMAEGLSEGFRAHFTGIHLYNPPHMMTGVEIIPHPSMSQHTRAALAELLTTRFGRQVILCTDTPAFAGNRIGFKVLNEVAQLAETHGVQRMDALVGPYTGRAMAPLATVDLVGWDVHQAIVDNLSAATNDEAHAFFKLPDYMARLIAHGHLGDKTSALGGFYRRVTEEGRTTLEVLDPASGRYAPVDRGLKIPFVEQVRDLHRRGRYQQGIDLFIDTDGDGADLARRVVLGYASYALGLVGQVVERYEDVDRIMSAGFNWVPPTALVDLIGVARTVQLLERYELPVPSLLREALAGDAPTPLFNLPYVTPGRYFSG